MSISDFNAYMALRQKIRQHNRTNEAAPSGEKPPKNRLEDNDQSNTGVYGASAGQDKDGFNRAADVCILTALPDPEFDQLLEVFPELQPLPAALGGPAFSYYYGEVDGNNNTYKVVATHQNEMGMTAASYHAADMIRFRPKLFIMTGICAGIHGKSNLGDLIVPGQVFDYGSGKITDEGLKPDFRHVAISDADLSAIRQITLRNEKHRSLVGSFFSGASPNVANFTCRTDPMASGAAVIADPKALTAATDAARKLCAIEMEAYGFMRTVRALAPQSRPLVLKTVTDMANEQKSDNLQKFGSFQSAKYCRAFLDYSFFDLETSQN